MKETELPAGASLCSKLSRAAHAQHARDVTSHAGGGISGVLQRRNVLPLQRNGYPLQRNGYPLQRNGYPLQRNGYPLQRNGYQSRGGNDEGKGRHR